MTEETALDLAHAHMDSSDAGRLQFYATLANTELFVLLERVAEGDMIEPQVFPVDDQPTVLAFDNEARLAEFAQEEAAYAALPGRIVAQLLGSQGLALGLNLDVAPSSMVLSPEALQWLTQTLGTETSSESDAQIEEAFAPSHVPDILLETLGARLTQVSGLAEAALLAAVRYADGGQGHLLAVLGAPQRAEAALTRAVSEALTFSGVDAGFLDVAFVSADHPVVRKLERVAMRFDIPVPERAPIPEHRAPGSDPDKPPRLH